MSKRVVKYIKKKYNVEPEEIWMKYPNRHAFRHLDNNKTFAVVADTPNNESVIGLKISEPLLRELLLQQDGYGLCCFMPKMTWISVTLNGLVSFEDVCIHPRPPVFVRYCSLYCDDNKKGTDLQE